MVTGIFPIFFAFRRRTGSGKIRMRITVTLVYLPRTSGGTFFNILL
jgi:hypothetical protein